MDMLEAMKARHSVRQYTDKKMQGEVLQALEEEIKACNDESGLHIQLILDEPDAFQGMMAKYGRFLNVRNYIALVGEDNDKLEEACGYYGERIVLRATQLGLQSCWVAMTYKKSACHFETKQGEKLGIIISIGYGENLGVVRKTKSVEQLAKGNAPFPEWFTKGMEAVCLAPTAMNQQKFRFEWDGSNGVRVTKGMGFYTKLDLGIGKYHFEVGAGKEADWHWL